MQLNTWCTPTPYPQRLCLYWYHVTLYAGCCVQGLAGALARLATALRAEPVLLWQALQVDAGQVVDSTAPIATNNVSLQIMVSILVQAALVWDGC